VLGRVAVAGMADPVAPADAQHLGVHQAPVARGHCRHKGRVVAALRTHALQGLGVGQPVQGVEDGGFLARRAGAATGGVAGGVPVAGADPQPALAAGPAPARGQPVREADVVRVHVRDDHAQHRQALQLVLEDLLPHGPRGGAVHAAVDDGPARAAVELVAQQPEVDVVEHEGQRHAQPAHARRELQAAAQVGQRVAQGVLQGVLQRMAHVGFGLH
jgi:hypothetical protein